MGAVIFRKLIGTVTSAVMLVSSIPFTASAADDQKLGCIDGYHYEMWNRDFAGTTEFEPGIGSFSCKWSNIENFLAMMGKKYDSRDKSYQNYDRIAFTYDLDITPQGNVTVGAYGWTQNPTTEFYIIDGWGDWRPSPSSNNLYSGSAVVNGHEYDVFKIFRYNQPCIDGTMSFPTLYSIRKENTLKNNQSNHIKDSIDITKHFASWEALGFDLSGSLYETMFCIEAYRSDGKAQLTSLHFGSGTDFKPVSVNPNKYYNAAKAIIDDDGYFYKYDFDYAIYDWQPRDTERLRQSQIYFEGGGSMSVSGRDSSWQGPVFPIPESGIFAGDAYSIGAVVMQNEADYAAFSLVCQYLDGKGQYQYDRVAEVKAPAGQWTDLSNTSYKIPENARDFSFFIETPDYTGDFYVDDAYAGIDGTVSYARFVHENVPSMRGDINCDGIIDVFDLAPLRRTILKMIVSDATPPECADVNLDGKVNVADLVCLQRYLLGAEKLPEPEVTTIATAAATTTTTTTTTITSSAKTTATKAVTTSKTTTKKTTLTATSSVTTTSLSAVTTAAVTATNTSAEKESYAFNAQYIFTHARKLFSYEDFPKTRIIGSRAELEEYISENEENYDFYDKQNWHSDFSVPFSEAVEKYSDEWFESHKLVIILYREGFINTKCHQVTKVTKDKIEIERLKNGGDMAICYWHFLVEVDKDAELNEDLEIEVTDSPDMDRGYPLG